MEGRSPRLLILVLARRAGEAPAGMLDRLPRTLLEGYDVEALVVDPTGNARPTPGGRVPLQVIADPDDAGYGGDAKLGLSHAVREGFDLVAVLGGDGWACPEAVLALAEPVRRGEADAVLGSRPAAPGARMLARVNNALTGARLSDWHTGCRVYSVAGLRRIQFLLDDDGDAFDTDVLLQLQHAGARIVELPVPAGTGPRARTVGVRAALRVLAAAASSFLHRRGLAERRRLDPADEVQAPYDVKLGFASSHTYALAAVPDGASVLDLGAGPGGMATALLRKGCRVGVVDIQPPAAVPTGVAVHVQDLDDPPLFPVSDYDVLLLLDVIEHLRDPERFLQRLREQVAGRPTRLVLSTPNVAFVVQRLSLAAGRFTYTREGILDRTHTRLFTFGSLRTLLQEAGFRDIRMRGVPAPFPKAFGDNRLGRGLLRMNLALIGLSPRLFSYQIFVEARPTPTVARRLDLALGRARRAAGRSARRA